jgi:hypothetical protein
VGYLPVMGCFIDSSCSGNTFNLGCVLECYYLSNSRKVILVPSQKKLLGFSLCISQIRSRVLTMLTAYLCSDNVLTPYSLYCLQDRIAY